jgi:hypothetical protein
VLQSSWLSLRVGVAPSECDPLGNADRREAFRAPIVQSDVDQSTRPLDEVQRARDQMGRQHRNVLAWSVPQKDARALGDVGATRGTMRRPRGMSIYLMMLLLLLLLVPTGKSSTIPIPHTPWSPNDASVPTSSRAFFAFS